MAYPQQQQNNPYVQEVPPVGIYQQTTAGRRAPPQGSIGMVIVVLAVITILGVIAGMVGRLLAGRRFSGDSEYDFEGWVERKCSTCIDGRIDSHIHDHIPLADAKQPEGDPPPA